MFLGEYQHTLDAKGRVILPAKFREQLEGGGVIAKTIDGCLGVYTMEGWQEVAESIREKARRGATERQAARTLFAGAAQVEPDRQGRIAIPPNLRQFAGLERDVVVAGVYSRIEIWDGERWRQRVVEGDTSLTAADDLPDFGI